jgi:predicted phosphodiesterase
LADKLPRTETVEVDGAKIYLLHRISDLDVALKAEGYKAVVMGHSHRASIKDKEGVFYINPGTAGPRRFGRLATLAVLNITDGALLAELVELSIFK